jgi:eukaryotic-like serine/threonine-protein kinase
MWIKDDASILSRLDALVDEYLDQADEHRAAWLDQLDQSQPANAQRLRLLLNSEEHRLPERNAMFALNTDSLTKGALTTGALTTGALSADGSSHARRDELPPGTQFGPWKVIRFHTNGGSADIYRGARADGLFERDVAIKYLRSRAHTSQLRFAREQMVLAKLEHPHIAPMIDAGIDGNGVPFLVMPWLHGETFAELDLVKQPLSFRLQWFQQIASAIEFAHRQLIVHCDLKPSNVMLVNEQAVVLDFGLARLVGAEQLQLTQQAFTPAYASPEQLRGEPVAVATDLHALGLMLFELLSSKPAYPQARLSLASAVNAIVYGELPKLPRIASFSHAQQQDAQAMLDRLLAKQPQQRYGNVSLLLQDIQKLMERQAISVRKRSLWGRLQAAWIRHHRLAWAALAGLSIATAYGVQYVKQNKLIESERAEAQLQNERKDALINHFTNMLSDGVGADQKTVRQALKESLEKLDSYYVNDFPGKANLASVLASLYIKSGDVEAADSVLRPIIENAQFWQLGPRSQRELLLAYAEIQFSFGKFDAVETALVSLKRVIAADSNPYRLAIYKVFKGRLMRARMQVIEGLELQTQGVEELRQSPYESDHSLGVNLFNLGSAYSDAGKLSEAKDYYMESIEKWKNSPDDIRGAETALARLLYKQGEYREALTILSRLELAYRNKGEVSAYHAELLIWLARTEDRLGNSARALLHAKNSLDMLIKSMGEKNPSALAIRLSMAEFAINSGENIEDLMAGIEGLATELAQQLSGPVRTINARRFLAQNQLQQADKIFAQVENSPENKATAKRALLWPIHLLRAEIAARLGDRVRQQQALDRAMTSVSIYQKETGLGRLEVSLWQQCMAERSATNAVARLATELGPEQHRVKALARCWD